MSPKKTQNVRNINRSIFKKILDEWFTLKTDGPFPLIIQSEDPFFYAIRDMLHGGNVAFTGKTGAGKSVRAEAATNRANLPAILNSLGFPRLNVEIQTIDIDLITTLANSELSYNVGMENSTSYRKETNIAEMILRFGCTSQEELERQQKANLKALHEREGTVKLFIVKADDFTRTQHRSIQNGILRFIESYRHVFPWRKEDDRVRYLNLQCIATTNASLDRSQGTGYLGDMGLDEAIANRFSIYDISEDNASEILKAEFDSSLHDLINRLVLLTEKIMEAVQEGGFPSLGEISMRQLRRIVQQRATGCLTEKECAEKLVTALPRGSDDGIKAELLIQHHFLNKPLARSMRF